MVRQALERGIDVAAGSLEHRPRSVAIGVFDGVHRGHQRLLRETHRDGLRRTALTFFPHPRAILGGAPASLTSLERRVELLCAHGASDVGVIRFDRQMAQTAPRDWAMAALSPLGTEHVVIGEGFRFGHRREGDAGLLERLGFQVSVVPLLLGVSSTAIRQSISTGRVCAAEHGLGRRVELDCRIYSVVRVDEGVQLTMRTRAPDSVQPGGGVYDAWIGDEQATLFVVRHGRFAMLRAVIVGRHKPPPRDGVRVHLGEPRAHQTTTQDPQGQLAAPLDSAWSLQQSAGIIAETRSLPRPDKSAAKHDE